MRGERVDGRNTGDVDDRDIRTGLYDALQQGFHHDLRSRAIERADHRQCKHAIPQRHNGRGQLEHVLLLPENEFFATLLEDFRRVEPNGIHELGRRPDIIGKRTSFFCLFAQSRKERTLECKHERRRFCWRVALHCTIA